MRSYGPDLTPPWKKQHARRRGGRRARSGRRGGHHRVLRRSDPLREDGRGADGHPGGPLWQAPGLPDGTPRLPAGGPRRSPWSAPRPATPTASRPYGLRLGRRPRRPRPGRARRADLRGGPARRGAGRAGVGRRPADRGRGRRVPGGHRRPAVDRRDVRPGPGRPARRPGGPPGPGHQGVAYRGRR